MALGIIQTSQMFTFHLFWASSLSLSTIFAIDMALPTVLSSNQSHTNFKCYNILEQRFFSICSWCHESLQCLSVFFLPQGSGLLTQQGVLITLVRNRTKSQLVLKGSSFFPVPWLSHWISAKQSATGQWELQSKGQAMSPWFFISKNHMVYNTAVTQRNEIAPLALHGWHLIRFELMKHIITNRQVLSRIEVQ